MNSLHAGERPRALEPQQANRSNALLNLDCSADLSAYSRSLGPPDQAQILPLSCDAIRLQFESHREHLLRHRRALIEHTQQAEATPCSSTNASVPVPNGPAAQRSSTHPPPDVAPRHALIAPRPPPSRSPGLPDDVRTYPPDLRRAREDSAHVQSSIRNRNAAYQVVASADRTCMGDGKVA